MVEVGSEVGEHKALFDAEGRATALFLDQIDVVVFFSVVFGQGGYDLPEFPVVRNGKSLGADAYIVAEFSLHHLAEREVFGIGMLLGDRPSGGEAVFEETPLMVLLRWGGGIGE